MDFEYFFFKPLGQEEFMEKFYNRTDNYPLDLLKITYTQWLIDYCRKAQIFYQFQYRKHSDSLGQPFAKLFLYQIMNIQTISVLTLNGRIGKKNTDSTAIAMSIKRFIKAWNACRKQHNKRLMQ